MYPEKIDPNKMCNRVAWMEVMLGYHINANHCYPPKREEAPPNSKRVKRMESKPPTCRENKTWDDFMCKQKEFTVYQKMAEITRDDVVDNMYRACNTPLRRKFVASNKIKSMVSQTAP